MEEHWGRSSARLDRWIEEQSGEHLLEKVYQSSGSDTLGWHYRNRVADHRIVAVGRTAGRTVAVGRIAAAAGPARDNRRSIRRDPVGCLHHMRRIACFVDRAEIHLDSEDRTSLVFAVGRILVRRSHLAGNFVEGIGSGRRSPVDRRPVGVDHIEAAEDTTGRMAGCCKGQTS